jgi:uncharacterized protein YqjF (DUF2071 family)
VNVLRPLVPRPLGIDTFDGTAWIAITPLTLWNVRPALVPPLPFVSDFHELNVRTYVHYDGVPGVWFFSLDANRTLAVWGARMFFYLPYFEAWIELEEVDGAISFQLSRAEPTQATFEARWRPEGDVFHAAPGSLEFFLIERYCLYACEQDVLYRCRINHEQWPLRRASLDHWSGDILEANGIPTLEGDPLVHAGGPVHVDVWPLERLTTRGTATGPSFAAAVE